MRYEFFLPMKIPNVTHQEKRIAVKNGKPVVYEDARLQFLGYLFMHKPKRMMEGPVFLHVSFFYAPDSKHKSGTFKTSKPDTDNLIKLFKDCMTKVGFWKDDAQVAAEYVEKMYWHVPGIHVIAEDGIAEMKVEEMDPDGEKEADEGGD